MYDGCKQSNKTYYSMNSSTTNISQLKQQIIETGDTSAYYDLEIQLLDYKYGNEELLAYALIMANKYEYPQAYFDVFDCLTAPYLSDISQIDTQTAQLAIEYLLLAADKGHSQAIDIVETYSIPQKCQDYIEQISKIFQQNNVG